MILIAARVLQRLLACHRYEDYTCDDDRDRMRTVDGFKILIYSPQEAVKDRITDGQTDGH